MVRFPPGFVIGGTILVLVWSVSLFWVAVSPGVPRVGYTCLGLLDSPGLLRVLMALAAVVGPLLPDFLGRAVVVVNFVGRFRGFIADAVTCWKSMASVWGRFCGGVCRSQSFAVTWSADFGEIVGGSGFSERFGGLLVVGGLAVAWVFCGGLRAWLSAQSLLVAVLQSLIARRRFGSRARWRPLRGALTSGLGLGGVSLAWPAVVQLLVFIYSDMQWNWPWMLVFVYYSD